MRDVKFKGRMRQKMLAATLGVFLFSAVFMLSVAAWLNDSTERVRLSGTEELVTSHIAAKAKVLVDNHALALTGLVSDNALGDIQALVHRTVTDDEELVYGLFTGQDGRPWAYSSAAAKGVRIGSSDVLQRWREIPEPPEGWSSMRAGQRRTALGETEVFEVSRPVVAADGELLGTIRYGFSVAPLARALASVRAESETSRRRLLTWLSVGVALSTALGALAISRIARRITEPLGALTSAANDIASGKTGVRVDVRSRDELSVLGAAFNHMQAANEEAMEKLRRAMDAALEASRLKSEFLANMSHEIRTPMNGVIGMLHLILRMPLDGKLRRYAETADASASALMTIINDVLDFSKMEAGKYELQSAPFEPGLILQEVAELMSGRAHEKGLELVYHRAGDVPQQVVGDPDRYRQVLNNLIGNAVKFTRVGEVYVELSLDRLQEDSCVLRTVVHDTGIGIAAEDQAKLFDAFSQVDGSMVREFGGTGLGLAISKRLVEMMGGDIGVSSERGIGSKFWFTIRVGVATERPSRLAAVPVGKRALIVEGSRRWCRVIEEYMGQWGVTTQSFQAGLPALERFRAAANTPDAFDVVVVGAQLLDADMQTFVRQLRSTAGAAKIPLIALTQLGESATLSEVENEVAAQVAKPLRPSELYDCLVSVFTGVSTGVSAVARTPESVRKTGLSILIVDDNNINRFVASEQVEQAGYEPVTADNGAQAVEMVKTGNFAAVLMDCQMPVMDGYTAAARIREWEGGERRIPIIALTAHALPGEREKVLAAGMDDYLSKPLRPHSLERMLRRHVNPLSQAPESAAAPQLEVADRSLAVELDAEVPRSHKLVDLFLTQVPGQIDGVDEALAASNWKLMSERAHKLKGGCLALGAEAMAQVAEAIQHGAPAADMLTAREQARALRRHFETVAALLLEEHPSLLPPKPGASVAPNA